jgi:hypothetical protein
VCSAAGRGPGQGAWLGLLEVPAGGLLGGVVAAAKRRLANHSYIRRLAATDKPRGLRSPSGTTNVPRPGLDRTHPSSASSLTARRTVIGDSPLSASKAIRVGMRDPGG